MERLSGKIGLACKSVNHGEVFSALYVLPLKAVSISLVIPSSSFSKDVDPVL